MRFLWLVLALAALAVAPAFAQEGVAPQGNPSEFAMSCAQLPDADARCAELLARMPELVATEVVQVIPPIQEEATVPNAPVHGN